MTMAFIYLVSALCWLEIDPDDPIPNA